MHEQRLALLPDVTDSFADHTLICQRVRVLLEKVKKTEKNREQSLLDDGNSTVNPSVDIGQPELSVSGNPTDNVDNE